MLKQASYILSIFLSIITICPAHSAAIQFGHVTVMDPILGPRDIVYEKRDGYAIAEDDIIIQKLSSSINKNNPLPGAIILLKLGGARWQQGIIPFELADNFPLQNKIAILDAIDTWQRNTHVRFVELSSQNRTEFSDYLSFVPTTGTTCSSYVGKQGGPQVIKLAARCGTMSIVHEIGHALGLWHEQSRADRDAYIQILWDNIEDNYLYNFNQHLTDGQDYGDYDYQSIMHYTAYAFSKNGEKTIQPLQDNIEIGQRDHLSSKDIAAVNTMYP